MQNNSFKVFDDYFMDSSGTTVVTSGSLPMSGNRVTMSVLLRNVSGSPGANDITWKMQISYDGAKWTDLGSGSIGDLTAFGHSSVSVGSVDAAFVRVAVVMTGAGDKILFDAWLAFAEL